MKLNLIDWDGSHILDAGRGIPLADVVREIRRRSIER